MNKIETEVWRPNPERPGVLKYVGQRSMRTIYQEVETALKNETITLPGGQVPTSLYQALDYLSIAYGREGELQDFPRGRIACFAVEGSNEGHYIHVAVIAVKTGHVTTALLGKTFLGLEVALAISNTLTRLFHR